jgi:hypothetical protein
MMSDVFLITAIISFISSFIMCINSFNFICLCFSLIITIIFFALTLISLIWVDKK